MIFTATEQPQTSRKRRNSQIKLFQQADGFVNGQPHHAGKAALQMLDKHAAQTLNAIRADLPKFKAEVERNAELLANMDELAN